MGFHKFSNIIIKPISIKILSLARVSEKGPNRKIHIFLNLFKIWYWTVPGFRTEALKSIQATTTTTKSHPIKLKTQICLENIFNHLVPFSTQCIQWISMNKALSVGTWNNGREWRKSKSPPKTKVSLSPTLGSLPISKAPLSTYLVAFCLAPKRGWEGGPHFFHDPFL